jgi:hypothetical protein
MRGPLKSIKLVAITIYGDYQCTMVEQGHNDSFSCLETQQLQSEYDKKVSHNNLNYFFWAWSFTILSSVFSYIGSGIVNVPEANSNCTGSVCMDTVAALDVVTVFFGWVLGANGMLLRTLDAVCDGLRVCIPEES